MFNKISIIGCGLIGSSILRAVEEKKLASKLSVFDKSSHVNSYLKKNFSSSSSGILTLLVLKLSSKIEKKVTISTESKIDPFPFITIL